MKNTSKTALLSLIAAIIIVGAGTATYLNTNYPLNSKADGLITKDSSILLPQEHLTVQETLRISDTVQIVSAFSPLEDGIFTTTLSLWRVDSSTNTKTKIHEFKSGVPAGLTTSIDFDYMTNSYVYTINESWEGIDIIHTITFDRDGNPTLITKN